MAARRAHYTVRIADQICEQIALGKTLQQALDAVGYLAPAMSTIWSWLEKYPDFRDKYERARLLQADIHADKMLEMSQAVVNVPNAANAYRVAIDVLKWQAEVRNKQRYGRKTDDSASKKPLDAAKLRQEIKRLEAELGVAESRVQPLKVVK